jgi:hypothetical protein
MDRIAENRKVVKTPWYELNPLVQEALRLGFDIGSREVQNSGGGQFPRVALPPGHRYFPDCLREQEARILAWLIAKYRGHAWFLTLTFKDYTQPDKAERLLKTFLARLNQAHKDISGAAQLISAHSTEWQQRNVIHYHLLIFGRKLGSLSRKRWEFRWQMMSGGFAAAYEAELKAAPYLVKHQVKDNPGSNLHVGGAWRGINLPRSVCCCSTASNDIWSVATASHQASIATSQVEQLLG